MPINTEVRVSEGHSSQPSNEGAKKSELGRVRNLNDLIKENEKKIKQATFSKNSGVMVFVATFVAWLAMGVLMLTGGIGLTAGLSVLLGSSCTLLASEILALEKQDQIYSLMRQNKRFHDMLESKHMDKLL